MQISLLPLAQTLDLMVESLEIFNLIMAYIKVVKDNVEMIFLFGPAKIHV